VLISAYLAGLRALGDYMHARGVLFGIYSDEGTMTCGGYPGSEYHEEADAKTLASWGVDYLKLVRTVAMPLLANAIESEVAPVTPHRMRATSTTPSTLTPNLLRATHAWARLSASAVAT
jgi:hypothetical protein